MAEHPHFHLVQDGDGGTDARADEVSRLRAELEARNRQEIAIAELGQAALTGVDPLILLGQACALVELTLRVSLCRALVDTPGARLILRAALGANDTFLRCTRDSDEDDSIGMVTLLADAPFTFGNLAEETRFKATHLHAEHGIRSGAGVVIRTQYGAFGVILAYANEERTFTDYELAFLRATANRWGSTAIRRSRPRAAAPTSRSPPSCATSPSASAPSANLRRAKSASAPSSRRAGAAWCCSTAISASPSQARRRTT